MAVQTSLSFYDFPLVQYCVYVVSIIFQMLEMVKDVVMDTSDLKTKIAKYRSVICIIWSVPKRKNKTKAKHNLLKIVLKWDHC